MTSLSPVRLGLTEKLANREYRTRFFARQARTRLAMQIKRLREKRNMNQTQFAIAAKMKQSAVSRIEQADYSGWTFKTLLRTAAALDARLVISLEPTENIIAEYQESERLAEWSHAADLIIDFSIAAVVFKDQTFGEALPSAQTPTAPVFGVQATIQEEIVNG